MSGERKFAKNLTGKGTAAKIRETASEALRESVSQTKPKLVEPLDYETVIVKNKTLLTNDPHREMLLFPIDDVAPSKLCRRFRTTRCSVPPCAIQEASSLLVKESIKTYTSSWNVIHYKYSAYSGSYLQLPKVAKPDSLPEQVFEVDAEGDGKDEEHYKIRPLQITHKGWLFKGPDGSQESSLISFTRSFKRRYFYLKQQADTTYVMEFHKDDKKLDAKGSIFLDSAVDVTRSSKRGRHTFELHMQDKQTYVLAAENEGEMDEWLKTLKKVIQTSAVPYSPDRISREYSMMTESSPKGENFRESLEQSNNPELQKYARETDPILAQQRKENRQKLFSIYPDVQRAPLPLDLDEEGDIEVYKPQFGTRFILRCEHLTFRLQADLSEDPSKERLSNPEPFFISFALYDAKEGKKISEDFHFDPNSAEIRSMIPPDLLNANDMLNSVDGSPNSQPDLQGLNESYLASPCLAVFSVTKPHPDIFLVARIEKVLQGSITAATDPYMKTPDTKLGTKMHKHMLQYCSRLGHYRMPFAWAARPIFRPYSMELDTYSDFALYRQESARISEEDLIKHLQDFRKPEKQGKWLPILGNLKVTMYTYRATLQNMLTSSLVPIRPFPEPPEQPIVLEVEEFTPAEGPHAFPFVTYTHHLYVYPKTLKYDSQKSFAKARNVACYVEIRDSDEEGSLPLKCIYNFTGSSLFTTGSTAAILHHNTSPDFNEEVKVCLPAQLHDKHHLVFTFYHVSCELPKVGANKGSSKRGNTIETVVGYAWFPLLISGRVNVGEQNIRVATNLPPGYLSHEQLGLGKGVMGPEVRWVDGGKPLYQFKLRLVSTTYTRDQHLHNFFAHCQKMEATPSMALDLDTSNRLKSLHAVEVSTMINFLPTLINQLFRLLTQTHNEDVALNAVRVLIHVVSEVHDAGKPEILHSYVKYVFETEPVANAKQKSVHEELAKHLKDTLRPSQADFLVIGKFMRHSWFFFEILIKSMAQHLLSTGRIKMSRNERFPSSFQMHIRTLAQSLVQHIRQKYKDSPTECKNSNISLAHFIKRCFTFMDRGMVFKVINLYIDNFCPGDPKILHEFKFEFLRIVCNHEHYIQLNLPIMRKAVKNYRDLKHDYMLSDEFRKNHFLVGLLLHEVKMALNEARDIRKFGVQVVRNLLAKHSFDDRYKTKAHQARISALYLPLLAIILENKERLLQNNSAANTPNSHMTNGHDVNHSYPETPVTPRTGLSSYNSLASLPDGSISPFPQQRIQRDPTVFAMISGQAPAQSIQSLQSQSQMELRPPHHDSSSSLASTSSGQSMQDRKDSELNLGRGTPLHTREPSISSNMNQAPITMRHERLDQLEIKDLLVCFLYIVKNLSEEVLLGWFNNSCESDVLDFFSILEISMQTFKYLGRKRITSLCLISYSDLNKKASTLPAKKPSALQSVMRSNSAAYSESPQESPYHGKKPSTLQSVMRSNSSAHSESLQESPFHAPSPSEADAMYRTMLEANLSSEVAMIVLDVVSLYTAHFKDDPLQIRDGDNAVMQKVFDLYLHFLQTSQSEAVQKHAFAALRSFINKFPKVLFQGEASMCGKMCYEILRCCNSKLSSTRNEACALLYILMRSNFEFSQRKSFTRVHLQVIISVSQLISDVVILSNARFTDSLSTINSFASNDKAMSRSNFPSEVKDLTKRIRTVLMATAQMKEHQNDPEMLVDLQYSLAKSYASTPELRRTWLESMAKIHIKHGDFSEAAHCYIHIAALVAEYLRRRGEFPQGCNAFKNISPNVNTEESGMRDDSGMQDVQYTEEHLVDLLEECARFMEKAERYELLGEIFRLIIPIYERRREFDRLADCYEVLHKAYRKVVEVQSSGKRLLGKYFRVAFYGQHFEEEDSKEYIYKEPKITGLTEICDRLRNLYTDKFGKGVVKLIQDSNKVNQSELDPKFAYIQVTYVTPYFDERELDDRTTDFERNNNIKRFMYETPFTKNGKPRGEIEEQYKRRTILITPHSFPYVKKRIIIIYQTNEELTPIEVACDAMMQKVAELKEVVNSPLTDLKKLQLKLQGSVSVQVNAGPVAYAKAFLEESGKYRKEKVFQLRQLFREFVQVCNEALEMNGRLITMDQGEYHEALKTNFREMAGSLSEIFGEPLIPEERRTSVGSHRGSLTVFNVISSTGSTSNV